MNPEQQQGFDVAVAELRRLARVPYEVAPELVRLRHRLTTEAGRSHRRILEMLASKADVDLQKVFDEAKRRNAVKRRSIFDTLKPLEERAREDARLSMTQFHAARAAHIRDFAAAAGLPGDRTQLKFRQVLSHASEALPGECNTVFGGWCSPDVGEFQASAPMLPSSDTPGMWLYPRIYTDTGDCEDTIVGRTTQELTYLLPPPDTSIAVDSVRVDLMANGIASAVFGDVGFLNKPSRYYQHTFVHVDVLIAQHIQGQWHYWPLVSDAIFVGNDEYVRQVRALLSGQTYPVSIVLRSPAAGGGELLCHLQVRCSAQPIGTDGVVKIDFGERDVNGIFVGGVAMLGAFV